MEFGTIKAVCISEKKGEQKRNVGEALLRAEFGLVGDAHGGPGPRQISLLSYDEIEAFNAAGADVTHGDFGENLVVAGIDLKRLPLGTRLCSGDVMLELTQIGKECHSRCQIYDKMGDCIMPREGVFAKVLQGGKLSVGDRLEVVTVGCGI